MKTIRTSFCIAVGAVAFVALAAVAGAATPVPGKEAAAPSLATPACGGGVGMMGSGNASTMGYGRGMGRMPAAGMPARLDAIKAGLGLRADQEPAWNLYVTAVNDAWASMGMYGKNGWTAADASPADRQAGMLQMRQHHQEAWQAVTAAGQTLMTSLDDAQKAKAQQSLFGFGACQRGGTGMMGCGGM